MVLKAFKEEERKWEATTKSNIPILYIFDIYISLCIYKVQKRMYLWFSSFCVVFFFVFNLESYFDGKSRNIVYFESVLTIFSVIYSILSILDRTLRRGMLRKGEEKDGIGQGRSDGTLLATFLIFDFEKNEFQ